MRLRKRIISVVLAACMAVTILPAGMPAKVSAAEETEETKIPEETEPGIVMPEFQEMPQILENETVPEWTGEEVAESGNEENHVPEGGSVQYIPTGKMNISFILNFSEKPDTDENQYVNIGYLFDEDDNIAARSAEPVQAKNSGEIWWINFYNIYRTRELKAGEALYAGYSNGNGEIHRLKNVNFIVTDQPCVSGIKDADRMIIGENVNYEAGLYSGTDNTSVVEVLGYNIDFSKLAFNLKDSDTGDIVATSVNCTEMTNSAYYCIEWKDVSDQYSNNNYIVEYNYSDTNKNLIGKTGNFNHVNYRNSGIVWNSKRNTVEYYNREMPSNIAVSYEIKNSEAYVCASGSGIVVDNSHLVTINLKNKLPYLDRNYVLLVKYEENGQEKSFNESFSAFKNDEERRGWRILDKYYSTSDNEIEISAMVYLDDVLNNESKLEDTCKINLLKWHKDEIAGEVELKLKKEGNTILYYGTYKGKLELGFYRFSFSPDGKNELRYCFDVYDNNNLYLINQNSRIANAEPGTVLVSFKTIKIKEWYCKNKENLDKFKIKILDIEGKEIGNYNYSDGDFTISDSNMGFSSISINFGDKIKEKLKNIYYYKVYIYYGDGNESDTIAKRATFSTYYYDDETVIGEYEDLYIHNDYMAEYIKWDNKGMVYMAASFGGKIHSLGNPYFYDSISCNTVYGNDSAFPAKLTITDWYSLKPIKEITINEPLHVLTESELDGLSSDKLYNFFLKGADGSANMSSGYIAAGNNTGEGDDEPALPTPSPTPAPGKPSGSGGGIGSYIPSVNNGGSTVTQPTTEPTAAPEVSATPAPTVTPTNAPTAAPTTQPTAIPEPTNAPVQTAPPVDIQEPDNQITGNYTPEPEKKTKLELKKKKITLKKGQKAKIKITSKLNTSVTYKSLKPSVATVSKKGVITAKKAGKAVITVKANGQVKKVEVTVKQAKKTEEKAVKSSSVKLGKDFKLAKASVTLKKGGKLTIKKASGLSGKVTFRSLDKKIASVSVNGVVKAKKKGKTAILIKNGKKTIKLKIVVKK